ncbi:MAG: hypothetical protein H6744_06850 [Deltaproteobacteria bacterium]|nr:hypothetical protein [Deltaproteobacteria bacterium]
MSEKEPTEVPIEEVAWFPECSVAPPEALGAFPELPVAVEDPLLVVDDDARSDVVWLGDFAPEPPFDQHPLTAPYRDFAAMHARDGGPLAWKAQLAQMVEDQATPPAPTPKPADFPTLRQHLIEALGLELPLAELAAREVEYAIGPWHLETRDVDGVSRSYEWADVVWRHDLLGTMDGVLERPVGALDFPSPAIVAEHGHDLPDFRFLPGADAPGSAGVRQWMLEFGGRELAEHGYVVFASGERSFHSWEGQTALLLTEQTTTPLLGVMVLETLTKIAILEDLPFVDPSRIGGLGHSAGGHRLRAVAAVYPALPIAVDYKFSAYVDSPPEVLPHCETIPQAVWLETIMQQPQRFPFAMLVYGYHYAPCVTPCGASVRWLPKGDPQEPPLTRLILRSFFRVALSHDDSD